MLRVVSSRFSAAAATSFGQIGHRTTPTTTRLLTPTQQNSHLENRRGKSKSYYDSEVEGPATQYTEFEKSYAEWKWVERLIPPKTVPEPPSDPSKQFSSGWTFPNPPADAKYVVRRSKNHMMSVYLLTWDRGRTRETRIRKVEGDIWALERDVGKLLKSLYPGNKIILTYTNEVSRYVGIRGDHVEIITEWLTKKGF